MRWCKHRCLYDVSSAQILTEGRISLLGQRKCMDCGDVVPYGPARNDGPHAQAVALEIRAAELAQALVEGRRANKHRRAPQFYSVLGFDGAEAAGHIGWALDSAKVPDQPVEWAGWLCGYIARKEES